MFLAMNRFSVKPDRTSDFEQAWRTRESYLATMPGFRRFAPPQG